MISRVAESCYWLRRYTERVENTARLLNVNKDFVADAALPIEHRWKPILIVSGELDHFEEFIGGKYCDDAKVVQDYLVWDEQSQASIVSSFTMARENARQIREVMSREMWESLNEFWHWLNGGHGRRMYRDNPEKFYGRLRDWPHQFQGIEHNTMLHEEPLDFLRLGMLLERAAQTCRILDVKYHMVGPSRPDTLTAMENASWLALLLSCSASEPFFKRHHRLPVGPDVAGFLVFEENFPRSMRHCLDRAYNFLQRIRRAGGYTYGQDAADRFEKLLEILRNSSVDNMIAKGLHEQLTWFIEEIEELCLSVQKSFFDPPFPKGRVVAANADESDEDAS